MRALETYIEQIVQEGERAQHSPGRTLIRRVLVRMAPWLTSPGGFKRHVTGDEIIYNAIRDDLEALRVASLPEAVRVAILMLLEDRKLGRDKDSLLTIVFHGGSSADGASAGEGRDQGWSREKVATVLVDAGAQVLDLLCRVNVLKVARGSAGPTYELVHDGIGPAIVAWAEREYFLFRDTISSIVARRGEVFRWREIGASEVRDAVWLGCNLTEVIARKVTFYNCRFSGSIFTDCDFSACRFIDCDMGGVTFVNGQWNDILWQSCQGRSAIFTSARWLGSVRIEGSILDNAMLVDLELGGHLEFNDSSLQFSQVGEFRFIDGASPRISFSGCDLQNSLLVAKQLSISDDCNENGLLRRPVPPIAPRRGRLSLWAKEGTCATS
ncbi:MAG TPA: pentapeptide repeat-containing protein [Thermoanaerobaculia bacterium]|nr:pentapeptide repeat-containing protein [Thermoanaerobaculia bacterium]